MIFIKKIIINNEEFFDYLNLLAENSLEIVLRIEEALVEAKYERHIENDKTD